MIHDSVHIDSGSERQVIDLRRTNHAVPTGHSLDKNGAKEADMRILLTTALCIFAFQSTDQSQSTPAHRIVLPGDIKWHDDGGGFFGAVMLGNSSNPGLYMFLNKGQDGARLEPHWHSRDENVIVLSGTFLVGFGDKFDEHALQAVPAGGYLLIPGNVHHFVKIKGETVWEVFGEGPFTYTSVPAPEMQRLAKMLVGTWTVDEDFAPGGTMPNGHRGSGRSVIEPGPGEASLIEDFISSSRLRTGTHSFGGRRQEKSSGK
jgi:quercetin dioxygenase-like cupin family protein